jgi:hypothetical protein
MAKYASYLPDSCMDACRSTAKTYPICRISVFLARGKLVPTEGLLIRLEDALVEIMFTLKHYYYGPSTGKFKQTKVGNTFTTTIEQVTILLTNTPIPSSIHEPTMKSIQLTPSNAKGKSSMSTKRHSSQLPMETSPSPSKKKKEMEGIYHLHVVMLLLTNLKASSSSSTQAEDEYREESTVMKSLT